LVSSSTNSPKGQSVTGEDEKPQQTETAILEEMSSDIVVSGKNQSFVVPGTVKN